MKQDQFHLTQITPDSPRNAWNPDTTDLNMNVIHLESGEVLAAHVNHALDVIVTCLNGHGTITLNDESVVVTAGSIVLIRRGVHREITAGDSGIVYTTIHRARGGMMPSVQTKR